MNRILSVLVLAQSQECADELRSLASDLAGVRLECRVLPAAAIPKAAEAAVNRILLVECGAEQQEDRLMLAQLARPGGPPVIAMVRGATIAGVRELMRLGVLDVLPRPVTAADLTQALTQGRSRLATLPQARGRVYSFMGSCGGAGTTTLAIQTAMELLQQGKARREKVCLIDLDLQFGNVGLALDLAGCTGLGQVIEASSRLDPAFLASAMAHHESGLDVLATPGEIVPFEALGVSTVEQILSFAREEYDHVVIDLPHAWTAWTPGVLAASSLVSLVLRVGVSGVQRARNHLRLMAEEHLDVLPKAVIANRVEQRWGNGWRQQIREASRALGHDIAFTVRRDDETAVAAQEAGKPLRAIRRNSVIEKDVRAFVEQALAMTSDAARPQAAAPAAAPAPVLHPFQPLKAAR